MNFNKKAMAKPIAVSGWQGTKMPHFLLSIRLLKSCMVNHSLGFLTFQESNAGFSAIQ